MNCPVNDSTAAQFGDYKDFQKYFKCFSQFKIGPLYYFRILLHYQSAG